MSFKKICVLLSVMVLAMACERQHTQLSVLSSDGGLLQEGKYLLCLGVKFSGDVTAYYETGQVKSRHHFENGLLEEFSKTWYASGAPETERMFHDGEKVGLHRGWWPNGNLRFEYAFSKGQYHGTFKEFFENGKPLNQFTYRNGEVVTALGWRENGKTYINFVVRDSRKYGLTNARLCYSLKDETGVYKTVNQ